MTTIEQILLKLGIDQSQIQPGLDDFKSKVNSAGQSAGKSFLHAENAARSFHKMLHEVAQQSPVLGFALRAAFSPVTAAMLGATTAFAYFKKQIEETNQRLDAIGDSNALRGIIRIKEALHAAAMEASKFAGMLSPGTAREQQSKLTPGTNADAKAALEAADKEVARLKKEFPAAFDVKKGEVDFTDFVGTGQDEQQQQIRAAETIQQAAQAAYEAGLKRDEQIAARSGLEKNAADAEKFLAEAGKKVQEEALKLDRLRNEESRIHREADREAMNSEQRLLSLTQDKMALRRDLEESEGDAIKTAEKKIELARTEVEIGKTKKQISEEAADYQRRVADVQARSRAAYEHSMDQFKPSLEQLEGQGTWLQDRHSMQWHFQPSELGLAARRVDWLQRAAFDAFATGHKDQGEALAKQAQSLRGRLEAAGVIKIDKIDFLVQSAQQTAHVLLMSSRAGYLNVRIDPSQIE